MNVWHLVLYVVILALAYIFFQYARIRKLPEGTDEMQEMAGIIRDGASTFLKTEFRVIAIVVIVVAAVFSLFVEKTSGITFIMGACMSSVVCILGMRSATYANVRTSNRARETLSIGETVKVALGGGSLVCFRKLSEGKRALRLTVEVGERPSVKVYEHPVIAVRVLVFLYG